MNSGYYYKIAKTNIKNNRKIYFPYILTSTCMVMILYIVGYLKSDVTFRQNFAGGATLQSLLNLGIWIIVIFSALFLFYTNSFITKRRKREFGLMSVLGLDKKNIALVMLCENLITNLVSIISGLVLGILLSKLVQGVLYHMLGQKTAPFDFPVNWQEMAVTAIVFIIIFAVIYLDSLRQVAFSTTIKLLSSTGEGEREPKANYVMAIIGALFLGAGYFMSQVVSNAVSAIGLFFVAVICVIIGTYGLFISGSVALTKLLKNNKSYYYKPNHFISVSGMAYRMKRNGAGLASICILSTMVLVMISTTVCMYAGIENTTRFRYPMDITTILGYNYAEYEECDLFLDKIRETADENNIKITEEVGYYAVPNSFTYDGNNTFIDENENDTTENIIVLDFISAEDYNKFNLTGDKITLEPDEVFLLTYDCEYTAENIKINDLEYNVKSVGKLTGNFNLLNTMFYNMVPHIAVFLPCSVPEFLIDFTDIEETDEAVVQYYIGLNIEPNDGDSANVLTNEIDNIWYNGCTEQNRDWKITTMYTGSYSEDFSWSAAMFGGLFFIAVILGLVFISGAVLIMYYKQVTEGYEDAGRYEIMQKVGMTDAEIRKSINSQVLTVFFAPLIAAGIHTAFSYNMIKLLLTVFVTTSNSAFFYTMLICYGVFAVFYVAVYLITSKAYYRTVKNGKLAMLN